MKKCGDCVHIYACELWNTGMMESTLATHCSGYETVKDTSTYYLGECDGKKDKWIPTGENMPEPNVKVLVTDTTGLLGKKIDFGVFDGRVWLTDRPAEAVLAWMPLPELYEED